MKVFVSCTLSFSWVIGWDCDGVCVVLCAAQSISTPGSGIWSDGKDKSDGSQAHTWNVEVLIDVVKEVVSRTLLGAVDFPWNAFLIWT